MNHPLLLARCVVLSLTTLAVAKAQADDVIVRPRSQLGPV